MRLVSVAIFSLLVGCRLSGDEVRGAIEACADRDGIKYVDIGAMKVHCNDGMSLQGFSEE